MISIKKHPTITIRVMAGGLLGSNTQKERAGEAADPEVEDMDPESRNKVTPTALKYTTTLEHNLLRHTMAIAERSKRDTDLITAEVEVVEEEEITSKQATVIMASKRRTEDKSNTQKSLKKRWSRMRII